MNSPRDVATRLGHCGPHLAGADQGLTLGQLTGVGTPLVVEAEIGGQVTGQPGQLGHKAPGRRRSPALLQDRPLDALDVAVVAVVAGRPARMKVWRAPSSRTVSPKTPSGTPSRCRTGRAASHGREGRPAPALRCAAIRIPGVGRTRRQFTLSPGLGWLLD
jgi:hypothetical protein